MTLLARFRVYSFFLSLLALQMMTTDTSAQFNVRIGYSLGFVSPDNLNQIGSLNQAKRALLFDEFEPSKDLNLMYGISLGVRYKFGIGALELNWESLDRNLSSTGFLTPEPPLDKSSSTEELQYSLNMLMVTYETNFGRLGVGSSIGKNFVSVKEVLANKDKLPLLRSANGNTIQYFARFHLSFNFFGNNTVAFAIKPFIQIGFTDVDLQPLADNFSVTSTENKESFPLFGLSFAFYNGRQ